MFKNNHFSLLFQYFFSIKKLSNIFCFFLYCKKPKWFVNILKRYFIKFYNISILESTKTDISSYSSINDIFTRKINLKFRPIPKEPKTLISPAEGTIVNIGNINEKKINIKGINFCILNLLGNSWEEINKFKNSIFVNIYLSPRDYHRVHMPYKGYLLKMTVIPGRLFSVSNKTVKKKPNLLSKNARISFLFHTKYGKLALVLIGSILVSSIKIHHQKKIQLSNIQKIKTYIYTTPIFFFKRGRNWIF